jgi:serine/threonine protein phosphatase PrpC
LANFNYYGFSDIGKKKKHMEDAFSGFILNENVLFICIADGLGSQKGLDVASMIAIEEFRNYMTANLKSDKIEDIEKEAKTAMYLMNRIIFAYQKMDPELYGNFSSTFTAVAINKRKEILIMHVGNTRLYLFRQGELFQMTNDDTIAQQLLEKKEITEQEYALHPDRGVLTKFLGMAEINPFITKGTLVTDDVLLLVSNGVYEMLPLDKIKQIFTNTKTSQEACEWIIEGSNDIGGVDNSAVVISYINW